MPKVCQSHTIEVLGVDKSVSVPRLGRGCFKSLSTQPKHQCEGSH